METKQKLAIGFGILAVFLFGFSIFASSYFRKENMFFVAEKKVDTDAPSAKVLVFGDMMLDRKVSVTIKQKGIEYPFQNIFPLLIAHDLVVGNLEGPFTDFPSKTIDLKNPILQFTFDPTLIPSLKKFGFTLFSLANNHTLNFHDEGLRQTREYLKKDGIDFFGDPQNDENNLSFVKTVNGIKFGFVGFHAFTFQNMEKVLAEIASLRAVADYVAVFPHWGEEYNTGFTEYEQRVGRAFIDAGADAVFGSHPHVIEPVEMYKNKPIFYSLGNFVFDQNFSKETTEGLMVSFVVSSGKATYILLPFQIKDQQISELSPDAQASILSTIEAGSVASYEFKTALNKGVFTAPVGKSKTVDKLVDTE